jgi:outer membrane protein TolC
VEGQPDVFDYDGRMNNEFMIEQTFPFPTKLFLKGTIASKEADIAYQKYKEEERDTSWHIEQPYYRLYLAKKTLEALEENQRLLEQLSRAIQARYESGESSQDDLLKIQIELSRNTIEVFNWRENVHIEEAHFSHLLDEPLDTQYVIVNDDTRSLLSYSRPELDRLAMEKRPELKALEIGIQRAKDSRTLAYTEWLPDITLRYEGRQFKGEDSVSEHDTFIGVTLPIWSLFKGVGGDWKSSEDELKAAEAMYTEMKNEVLLALHEAYSKVKAARNALNVYEHSILPQAKLQVEVALASYEAGRADFMNVIDAERTLRNTQIEYHKAVAEYEMGFSDLRLAAGDGLAPVKEGTTNEV